LTKKTTNKPIHAFLCTIVCCAFLTVCSTAQQTPLKADGTPGSGSVLPRRQYHEGEKISYHMKGTNRDRAQTIVYEVQADGIAKKDADGRFVEEFTWSRLVANGAAVTLDPAAANFRQILSLEPHYPLSVPDLSHVIPLIGPITDLLTFYADVFVARSGQLVQAGDHFYFKHGTPNSWADETYVILGQDSIDFDVTLAAVNASDGTLTLKVRHVPPEKPQISLPADWMRSPVADTPNNWVQVSKLPDGKYDAEVGKETFDVELKVSLGDGKILSGSIDNPVEVVKRDCSDTALQSCGEPVRFQIRRQIEIY
jgi:hypothetical protein